MTAGGIAVERCRNGVDASSYCTIREDYLIVNINVGFHNHG